MYQDLSGSALNIDWKVGRGVLTSTSGWRSWNWNPSNDRDFIGVPVTTVSAAPSSNVSGAKRFATRPPRLSA